MNHNHRKAVVLVVVSLTILSGAEFFGGVNEGESGGLKPLKTANPVISGRNDGFFKLTGY